MKKILVDMERCIGAGQCVRVAPGLFAQSADDGLVIVKKEHVVEGDLSDAEIAALSCPSQAIRLTE